ncbi:3-carboxy-cis,cis-muconate cycloisomerase [Hasllibacter halocynthiae]|uniref:3-carboxy-cis,cis-muconate cycloisomerase n=1 Tax=Hasllibacter halocynthiae TaxID=595589 RepID=A0A2T0X229_9RHOB|nr:lyase family protein [Hasllibacter halocynthiae]PRY92945.1 3-carboxy-cis,cis-muconate cycloisomerase [Hasllibacter halocynthiae]
MPASPFSSRLHGGLFAPGALAPLLTDGAEVRSMLLVWRALAAAQAAEGLIPETAARAIGRAALEAEIDPAALAEGTARSAVPVPALLAAFREAVGAPEPAGWVHWGATSQDVMDTALALRLRQALLVMEDGLDGAIRALAALAGGEAATPLAARTWAVPAVPTTLGAVAAEWGRPLLAARAALGAVRADALRVSLSGAAGTLSAMGPEGPAVRARMAGALGLLDPGASIHADRQGVAGLSAWCTRAAGASAKAAEDVIAMVAAGEARLEGAGASSTMPQKANPVLPSLVVALARAQVGLDAALQGARIHRGQRDGAAWMTEWLLLPQVLLGTNRALTALRETLEALRPDRAAMAAMGGDVLGLIHAEAISLALTGPLPRAEAQAETQRLAARARAQGTPLPALAARAHPDVAFPPAGTGTAEADARAFAARAREALG